MLDNVETFTSATLDSTGSSSSLENRSVSVWRVYLSLGLMATHCVAKMYPGTHWNSACFSEKTRTQKSPSLLGSKVEGTMRYSPGGRQKREQTSRRLMKVSDRAAEACRTKKLRSRWTFLCPTNCNTMTECQFFFFKHPYYATFAKKNLNYNKKIKKLMTNFDVDPTSHMASML